MLYSALMNNGLSRRPVEKPSTAPSASINGAARNYGGKARKLKPFPFELGTFEKQNSGIDTTQPLGAPSGSTTKRDRYSFDIPSPKNSKASTTALSAVADDLRLQLQVLQEHLIAARGKKKQRKRILSEKDKEISELRHQLSQRTTDMSVFERELHKVQQERESLVLQLEDSRAACEREVWALKKKMNSAVYSKAAKTAGTASLSAEEHFNLNDALMKALQQRDVALKERNKLENTIQQLKAERKTAMEQRTKTETKLKFLQGVISSLKTYHRPSSKPKADKTLALPDAVFDDRLNRLEHLVVDCSAYKTENVKLQRLVHDITVEFDDKRVQLDALQEKYDRLKREIDDHLVVKEAHMNELNVESSRARRQSAVLQEDVVRLLLLQSEKDDTIKTLRREVSLLKTHTKSDSGENIMAEFDEKKGKRQQGMDMKSAQKEVNNIIKRTFSEPAPVAPYAPPELVGFASGTDDSMKESPPVRYRIVIQADDEDPRGLQTPCRSTYASESSDSDVEEEDEELPLQQAQQVDDRSAQQDGDHNCQKIIESDKCNDISLPPVVGTAAPSASYSEVAPCEDVDIKDSTCVVEDIKSACLEDEIQQEDSIHTSPNDIICFINEIQAKPTTPPDDDSVVAVPTEHTRVVVVVAEEVTILSEGNLSPFVEDEKPGLATQDFVPTKGFEPPLDATTDEAVSNEPTEDCGEKDSPAVVDAVLTTDGAQGDVEASDGAPIDSKVEKMCLNPALSPSATNAATEDSIQTVAQVIEAVCERVQSGPLDVEP